MYKIWRIYLDFWGHDCKKWVWPTYGCKLCQNDPIVMQLKLDMSCHLLNVYTKFQIDISKHVEEKSRNADGRTDERTDGRTLPRHNTSRFSNGRIKIKKNMVISCYYSLAWILGCPQAISCCHWLLIKWSKVELLISGHARWFTISISEWHVASDQINSSSYTWDIIVMFKIHWNVKKYISPEDEYS